MGVQVRPFDVTVLVAPALRTAFEGKREVTLGVPAGAGVGEVLEALLQLYPRLRTLVVTDRDAAPRHLHLALPEATALALARGQGGLAAGQRLYLFGLGRRRQGRPESGG